jgi:hypothetical protein
MGARHFSGNAAGWLVGGGDSGGSLCLEEVEEESRPGRKGVPRAAVRNRSVRSFGRRALFAPAAVGRHAPRQAEPQHEPRSMGASLFAPFAFAAFEVFEAFEAYVVSQRVGLRRVAQATCSYAATLRQNNALGWSCKV